MGREYTKKGFVFMVEQFSKFLHQKFRDSLAISFSYDLCKRLAVTLKSLYLKLFQGKKKYYCFYVAELKQDVSIC